METDAIRPLIVRRFSKIGRYMASAHDKVPNTLTVKEKAILEDRLRRAIKTSTYGLQRTMSIDAKDADMFWYTLAIYVALEYQVSFINASKIPDWPVRLDTQAPVTRVSGLRYKIPKGFEHIHDEGIVTLANGFGSRYASSYRR